VRLALVQVQVEGAPGRKERPGGLDPLAQEDGVVVVAVGEALGPDVLDPVGPSAEARPPPPTTAAVARVRRMTTSRPVLKGGSA
jgi:hypothetical protein